MLSQIEKLGFERRVRFKQQSDFNTQLVSLRHRPCELQGASETSMAIPELYK